ncbi:amidase family protein [Variovorax sp. ZT5P49]|uniref:amidase family protein n=1 Tax=Variovorax sp. ZT5P49 TaxID=3443733 RepID=UPI003F462023
MLHRLSYDALRRKYRSRQLSPVAVAESALEHAARVDESLNAFALIDRKRSLAAAAASEQRWRAGAALGPLDGVPITVKEFVAVKGWPSRRGSLTTTSDPMAMSAVFADRLLRSGAVVLGKTRAPEFNWKGVTDSPGFGITRNPWNLDLTPGGSSGGCAAAVAAGVTRVSIGSDAGGSVRIPAAFAGVIGLKPTFGRIPATPLPSAFLNVVHSGPLAASMSELRDALSTIAGPSGLDWTSVGLAEMREPGDAKVLRIGLLKSNRWDDSHADVKAGMELVLAQLTAGGFQVQEVDYDVRGASEVGKLLYRVGCSAAVKAVPEHERWRLDPGLIRFVSDLEDCRFSDLMQLMQQRDVRANALHALFDDIDVLMLPTMPISAFAAGRNTPADWPSDDWMSWNPYTPAFNVSHVPALSYPVWPGSSAMPIGVQFVAAKGREDVLFSIGEWLEPFFPVRLVGD